jgi:hypothetical protein
MIDNTPRHILLPLALSLLLACSKDDGDGGDDGTGSASDAGGDGTSGQTGDDGGSDDGTDGGGDDGTDGTSDDGGDDGTGGTSDDGGDPDTGDPEGAVVLQNDSWTSFDGLNWQGWPGPDDCIASVYEIDNQDYPFEIYSIRVIIGNADATEDFRVGIWEVNNQNVPTTEIDSEVVPIQGNAAQIPEIKLADAGILVDPINNGTFAAVVCHVDHMGAPSFATDLDGDVVADRNFVWQDISGEWVQAPDFFNIDGDFILRAVIIPQG